MEAEARGHQEKPAGLRGKLVAQPVGLDQILRADGLFRGEDRQLAGGDGALPFGGFAFDGDQLGEAESEGQGGDGLATALFGNLLPD